MYDYKKLDLDFWHMLLAPAGTPRPIVDQLHAELKQALAAPQSVCCGLATREP